MTGRPKRQNRFSKYQKENSGALQKELKLQWTRTKFIRRLPEKERTRKTLVQVTPGKVQFKTHEGKYKEQLLKCKTNMQNE